MASRVCLFALTIEVFAKCGRRKVKNDITKMKETKTMEPYLRELYYNMQLTADITGELLKGTV